MAAHRIAIWGHYHGGNQGDDVVVRALRDEIRARFPDAEVLGISLNPADTRERHGIRALPLRRTSERAEEGAARPAPPAVAASAPGPLRAALRRLRRWLRNVGDEPGFLWRSYRHLRGVDLIVVAGSGPLSDDWMGPWSHPYTIFKWSLLARLAGARFAFASVGAGPIDHALTPRLLRLALRWACYRSYRDASSAEIAGRLHRFEPEHVFPDLAFGLAVEPARPARGAEPLVVGLNAIPYFDARYWPYHDAARYRRYLDETAAFTAGLLRRGMRVVVVYSQLSADQRVAEDLRELLRGQGLALDDPATQAPIRSQEQMLARIALCDVLVAGRFHCILLPYLLGKPVVGLAYHAKTVELMRSMGQADYCLDIERFDAASLTACFDRLLAHADQIRVQLAPRVAEQRRALTRLYDELLTAGLGAARATHEAEPLALAPEAPAGHPARPAWNR